MFVYHTRNLKRARENSHYRGKQTCKLKQKEEFKDSFPANKSVNTQKSYLQGITYFFKSVYGETENFALAERYFTEKREYERDIEEFFNSISHSHLKP